MKIIILGAGVIGVTTAYQLAKKGYEVHVIEKNEQAAMQCSYANGGQLSYSHAQPWATPNILPRIPKWLFQKNSPLSIGEPFDYKLWPWIFQFIKSCNQTQSNNTTEKIIQLAFQSKKALAKIESDTNIKFQKLSKGTLHIFKTKKYFDNYLKQAKLQEKIGCNFEILNKAECENKEPALNNSTLNIQGGIFFSSDESGDINQFTTELARHCQEKLGVKFSYSTSIKNIEYENNTITAVNTNQESFNADHYICTLGAYSNTLLNKIGINLPIYPLKGYSISIPINKNDIAPNICITDQSNKIVTSRIGNILRVAGLAEFSGYNHDINENKIQILQTITSNIFPNLSGIDQADTWSCLRPSTPDGLPIIGTTKYDNLFLNTGHGSLGWTLACGSAFIISDLIDKKNK